MEHWGELALRIVKEGLYMPSARCEEDGEHRSRWLPAWGHPELERTAAEERSRVENEVDALVRGSFAPRLRESAFTALQPRYGVPNTPLERWAYGLLTDGEASALPDWLAEDIADWSRGVEGKAGEASIRVAFVLLAPERFDGEWLLVPGLAPTDDERRFVPARRIWANPEQDPMYNGRCFPDAQGALARGLSEAAQRFPPVVRLRAAEPGIPLRRVDAIEFLERTAPAMERFGFDIIPPAWWDAPAPLEAAVHFEERRTGQGLSEETAAERGPSLFSFESLMSYRKELLLGGESIAPDEWEQWMAREETVLFRRGRWFRLRPSDRRAGTRFFRGAREGSVTAAEALRLALTVDASQESDDGAEPSRPEAAETSEPPLSRWSGGLRLERLVAMLSGSDGDGSPPPPDALRGELRDYQARGYAWLVRMRELGFGVCLADDMGLGKTVQWIAYALRVKEDAVRRRPMLLLCPTSVLGNWQRELARFAPSLRVHTQYGSDRPQGEALTAAAAGHDLVLTSYGTALRDAAGLAAIEWDAVTLDEAQYVKNSSAQLSRFVRGLRAAHRIALTGTPVENKLSDLWSVFEFINPGYLGSERSFLRQYGGSGASEGRSREGMAPEGAAEPSAGSEAQRRLRALVRPFLLRRMKSDQTIIMDLPDKIEHTSYCSLTERQAAMYAATLERLAEQLRRVDGMRRRGVILSAITRLKQICNAPEHALRERALRQGTSGKLNRLEELLREGLDAHEDGRCIVFTQYAAMASLLQPYLERTLGCDVGLMIGKTPRKEREAIIERFQHDADGPRVLVLSLKTGGFGLNLTRANRIIHYDRWWNPASERQATDRAYRIGQTRTVEVWKLVARGTLEESIMKLLENKERLAEHIVGSGERWLTEVDDAQLRELLALRE